MKIPALYLDTSAIGGFFDDEWQEATRELWRQMEAGQWRFVTSVVSSTHWNSFMNPKKKAFDCVAESRNWREATSAKLNAMSVEEELAYLHELGERARSKLRGRQPMTSESAVLREDPPLYGGERP